MTHSPSTRVSNRVLKLNVGFLLSGGPGHSKDSVFDFPAIRVADDLTLNYLRGPIRLSRTKEGVLVQAHLETSLDDECYRCLEPTEHVMTLDIEELFAFQRSTDAEFSINEDAILNLAPLLRAEVLIQKSHGTLCQPNCKGLCPECGANLNHVECSCDREMLDPRLAVLKELLD